MKTKTYEKLYDSLEPGTICRRSTLLTLSKAIDRDLGILTRRGVLEKLAGGLYYKPKISRLGRLPPNEQELIACFLNDNNFLLYSWNQYNSLGFGLTQLYNQSIVYNRKRHGLFRLGNKTYDFRRPNNGFPNEITAEFLVIDLLNTLDELAEDKDVVKLQIKDNLHRFDTYKIKELALTYGKISTKHFLQEFEN